MQGTTRESRRPTLVLPFGMLVLLGGACGGQETAPRNGSADGGGRPVRIDTISGDSVHPSLCAAKNGDLLVVYSRGGRVAGDMRLSRSSDGGKTWSEPAPLAALPDATSYVYPGGLTRLRDGRIVLSWSAPVDGRGRAPWFCVSGDDGISWTEPRLVPLEPTGDHDTHRYSFVELADGRWMFSLWNRAVVFDSAAGAATPLADERHAAMVPIVRTANGTLVSGGTSNKRENGLRSTDDGESWQPLRAFGHLNHGCPFDLTALDDGRIVHTTILYELRADATHCPETVFLMVVSRDDGRTWDWADAVTIYDKGAPIQAPRGGWPRTCQVDRQTLGTVFFDQDKDLPGGGGLFFLRTPLARLTPAGRD